MFTIHHVLSSDGPGIPYVGANPSNDILPGQQVLLHCSYASETVTKPVTIKWFQRSDYNSARVPLTAATHNISDNRLTLTFDAIGRNESGFYECEVQNEVGSGSGRTLIRVYRKYMTVFSPLGAPNQACRNTGAGSVDPFAVCPEKNSPSYLTVTNCA